MLKGFLDVKLLVETVNIFWILSTPEPQGTMKIYRCYERETTCHECAIENVVNLTATSIFQLEYAAGGFQHISPNFSAWSLNTFVL